MKSEFQKYFSSLYPQNIVESMRTLEDRVEKGDFTAWSFANRDYAVSAFWADEYELDRSNSHPVFDLASLTKPLFINLYLILEYKKKYLDFVSTTIKDLNFHLPDLLKNFVEKNSNLTINSFLSHRTKFKPWCWMGGRSAQEITEYILNNFSYEEGKYSDLNYYILTRILESFLSWQEVLDRINLTVKSDFKHASLQPPKRYIPYYPYRHLAEGCVRSCGIFWQCHRYRKCYLLFIRE
jgi:hypothetical protein